jgi:CHASE3 domain sensor protein
MFASMKTGSKILAGFALALLLMAAIGLVAYRGMGDVKEGLHDVARVKFPSADAISVANEAKTAVARGINTLLLRRADDEMRRGARADITAAFGRLQKAFKDYEALPHGESALEKYREAKAAVAWRTAMD